MARVLIVDDEGSVRSNLAAYLEDDGLNVETASSGEAALEMAERIQPDVCVMDMRLPGIDGNDTIRAMHVRFPHVLFVIHTATAEYALPDDLRRLGITDQQVFRKPVTDMAPLAQHIERLAREKRYPQDE